MFHRKMTLPSSFFQYIKDSFFNETDNGFTPKLVITFSAIFAVFWYTWMLITKSNKQKSPPPPGPRGLPIVGNLPFLDPELHTYFATLARTYGPVFKLQLGQKLAVIINSPSSAREVLKDHDVTFANRDVPVVGREATYGGRDIVWNPYGPEWRMLRKVCVLKMLNTTTLDSVYALRRREVRETVGYLYSQAGSPVSVGEQMFLTILNVITNMLWGSTVQGDDRASIGAEFRQVVSDITELLGIPNISDFFPGLARFDLQGLVKKTRELTKKLDKIFEVMIDQQMKMDRGNNGKQSKDFLQFLLQLKDEVDSKTPLTKIHVKALLMNMVVGGTDTTSNSIEFSMAEILNKPEVMKRAQRELDEVIGKDNVAEESHLHKLPFLHAVLKETLRLHPPLPLLVPHCPSEASTVGGYTVPKGARVFINVWAIQRDPSVWENPLEFNPDRFLNNNSKCDYNGSDFNYLPFGSGRRICPGIGMAERLFLYSMATLLHSFDWKLPEGQKPDFTEKFGIVLKLKNPLMAIPTPRLADPALYGLA